MKKLDPCHDKTVNFAMLHLAANVAYLLRTRSLNNMHYNAWVKERFDLKYVELLYFNHNSFDVTMDRKTNSTTERHTAETSSDHPDTFIKGHVKNGSDPCRTAATLGLIETSFINCSERSF